MSVVERLSWVKVGIPLLQGIVSGSRMKVGLDGRRVQGRVCAVHEAHLSVSSQLNEVFQSTVLHDARIHRKFRGGSSAVQDVDTKSYGSRGEKRSGVS